MVTRADSADGPQAPRGPSTTACPPALAVRLVGFILAATGGRDVRGSLLLAWAELPFGALVLLVGIVLVVIFAGAWWISRRAYVVRLTDQGYRVRFIRGAGATRARWSDVEKAVTTTVAGAFVRRAPAAGRALDHLPVSVLAVGGTRFAKDVRARLPRGRVVPGEPVDSRSDVAAL